MRACARFRYPWPRRSNRRGFLFQGVNRMIDPFTVVVTALGLAIVASLRLTAGISGNVYAGVRPNPARPRRAYLISIARRLSVLRC